jgi:DHA1 family multidrug resistance protein-like MFS transporter
VPTPPRPAARAPSLTEQTWLICALIGTTQMTWGTIVPALPLYIDRFGATALVLGPIVAAFGFGRILTNIPAGLALRRLRPRPFLYTACVLLVLITGLTGFSPDAPTLIVLRVIAGILGGTAITVGFAVLVSGAPPDRRGRVMATVTAVQMSAGAIGAFLGGLALSWFPLEVAFVVAVVPLALALAWDLLRPARHYWSVASTATRPDPSAQRVATPGTAAASPHAVAPAALPHTASPLPAPQHPAHAARIMTALAVASFAAFFARFGGEQGLIPLLGYDRGGLTPLTLGIALAAATVVSLTAMPLIGRIIDRGSRLAVFVPGVLLSAAAMLAFSVATGPWLFALVIVVYGLSSSIGSVVPSVVMSDSLPGSQSGFVVGLTRTAGDIGAVIGPLVAFAAYDAGGPVAAVATITVVLLLANIPLVATLLRRRAAAINFRDA